MKKIVRESKFRHIYGQLNKETVIDGVNVASSRADGQFVAGNRLFYATVLSSSGGGAFTVIKTDTSGRCTNYRRINAHSMEIVDLAFDPHFPNRIMSGSNDGTFKLWTIPEEGLCEDMDKCTLSFSESTKRAIQCLFHPSCGEIVILANADVITIWSIEIIDGAYVTTKRKQIGELNELFSLTMNSLGNRIATTSKDKKCRVYDLPRLEQSHEFEVHEGVKPCKVTWCDSVNNNAEFLITTGFSKQSERQIALWNLSSTSEPLQRENLSSGVAPCTQYFDSDTNIFCCFSKGETYMFMYELSDGKIYSLPPYSGSEPQCSGAFANKLACNVYSNEVIRFVRCTAKGLIEPVAMTITRRGDQFQEDLFPPTVGEECSMSVDDFLNENFKAPALISLKNVCINTNLAKSSTKAAESSVVAAHGVVKGLSSNTSSINDLNSRIERLEESLNKIAKHLGLEL